MNHPIIICGAPRSGTTLLTSILDSHPEIVCIPYETMLFIPRKRGELNHDSLRIRITLFLTLISLKIGKSTNRWCEKTPYNVLYISKINQFFNGKVRFIHIIRDGRDVVLSHHSHLGSFMTPGRWAKCVEAGLDRADMYNLLTIRYEDLVRDNLTTLARIEEFLELRSPLNPDFYINTGVGLTQSFVDGKGYEEVFIPAKIHSRSIGKYLYHKDNKKLSLFDLPRFSLLLKKLGYK